MYGFTQDIAFQHPADLDFQHFFVIAKCDMLLIN